jgi:hypothetical protein
MAAVGVWLPQKWPRGLSCTWWRSTRAQRADAACMCAAARSRGLAPTPSPACMPLDAVLARARAAPAPPPASACSFPHCLSHRPTRVAAHLQQVVRQGNAYRPSPRCMTRRAQPAPAITWPPNAAAGCPRAIECPEARGLSNRAHRVLIAKRDAQDVRYEIFNDICDCLLRPAEPLSDLCPNPAPPPEQQVPRGWHSLDARNAAPVRCQFNSVHGSNPC